MTHEGTLLHTSVELLLAKNSHDLLEMKEMILIGLTID